MYEWLDVALDYGISELDFWNMTLAEIERAINSKKRIEKQQKQEKAYFDYTLANLIGMNVGRIYSDNDIPRIEEVYNTLFDSTKVVEEKQNKQDELSALRFKQFADAHNKKINKEVAKDE